MNRYAVVDDVTGVVRTVVVWDGIAPWAPPAGTRAMLLATQAEQQNAEPGGAYDNVTGVYTRPVRRVDKLALLRRAIDVQARLDALAKLDAAVFPDASAESARLQAELDGIKGAVG